MKESPDLLAALRLILAAARGLPCTCRPVDQDGPAVQCEACFIVSTAETELGA